jgi:hypothetical protein
MRMYILGAVNKLSCVMYCCLLSIESSFKVYETTSGKSFKNFFNDNLSKKIICIINYDEVTNC